MTCCVCGKDFIRLKQHLNRTHNIQDRIIEPDNMFDYLRLLQLMMPFPKDEQYIDQFISYGTPLPKDIKDKLTKNFKKYTENSGVKVVIQVGYNAKKKQQNNNQPISNKVNATNEEEDEGSRSTMLSRKMNKRPSYLINKE